MAQNIEINYYTGSSYIQLYPKTKIEDIIDLQIQTGSFIPTVNGEAITLQTQFKPRFVLLERAKTSVSETSIPPLPFLFSLLPNLEEDYVFHFYSTSTGSTSISFEVDKYHVSYTSSSLMLEIPTTKPTWGRIINDKTSWVMYPAMGQYGAFLIANIETNFLIMNF